MIDTFHKYVMPKIISNEFRPFYSNEIPTARFLSQILEHWRAFRGVENLQRLGFQDFTITETSHHLLKCRNINYVT